MPVFKRQGLFGPDKQKPLFRQIAHRFGPFLRAVPLEEPREWNCTWCLFVLLFTCAECGAGGKGYSDGAIDSLKGLDSVGEVRGSIGPYLSLCITERFWKQRLSRQSRKKLLLIWFEFHGGFWGFYCVFFWSMCAFAKYKVAGKVLLWCKTFILLQKSIKYMSFYGLLHTYTFRKPLWAIRNK